MLNIKRLFGSFGFAFEGLAHAFKRDQNLRIHATTAFVVIIAGLFLRIDTLEMLAVIIVIGMVFIAELVNTAIEQIIDFVVQERKAEAKIVKDVAAGMVFIAAITSVLVGVLVFIPKILLVLTK